MQLALVVLVACVGVIATLAVAVRMWRAARSGAPTELVLGYVALLVLVGAASLVVLRLL